jgi:hypothetical protein
MRRGIPKYFSVFGICSALLICGHLNAPAYAAAYAAEIEKYNSRGKRDPFVPLVGVAETSAASIEDIMSIDDVNLQGTAGDSAGKMFAIINGEMITEGETRGRLTVKEISESRIRLLIDKDEFTLDIYEDER